MSDKIIDSVAFAPVVSSDVTSKEAIMARESKKIETQANTDGRFDTQLERFTDMTKDGFWNGLLLAGLFFLLADIIYHRK